MKNKATLPLVITFSVLACIWVVGRITGALQLYKVPGESNAPTFKPGNHFFTSNLKKPTRNHFVAFRREDDEQDQGVYFSRVIALPGDVVVIKDGIVKVNSKLSDEGLDLNREYILWGEQKNAVLESYPDLMVYPRGGDSVSLMLSDRWVAEKGIQVTRYVQPGDEPEPTIQRRYGKPWNADQFGPLQIPAKHYFVLGDNRHNALDSRYVGLIAEADIVGTIIGNH